MVLLFSVQFEWDERKAKSNLRKHGVTFDEAISCFGDPHALMADDDDHPERVRLVACRAMCACSSRSS